MKTKINRPLNEIAAPKCNGARQLGNEPPAASSSRQVDMPDLQKTAPAKPGQHSHPLLTDKLRLVQEVRAMRDCFEDGPQLRQRADELYWAATVR